MEFFSNPIIIFLSIIILLCITIILLSFFLGLLISLIFYFMKIFGIKFKNIDYRE